MAPTSTPQTPFGRVLTAMVTPFTADGGLDLDGAQRLATHDRSPEDVATALAVLRDVLDDSSSPKGLL